MTNMDTPKTNDAGNPVTLYETERNALESAAKLLDIEARTWADGFAVSSDGKFGWPAESQWAHVRYTKLVNAAASLRGIAARWEKKKKSEGVH